MRKILFLFTFFYCILLFSQKKVSPTNDYFFYENKGQIMDQDGKANPNVKYLFHSAGLNVQLRSNGFSYDVYQVEKVSKNKTMKEGSSQESENFKYKYQRVDIDLINSNPNSEIISEDKSPDFENFYNVPSKPDGILNVHRFRKVIYKNIYNNIDLVFFKPNDTLKPIEYNFIVKPGGKVSDIKMKFNGVKTSLRNNKVMMQTRFGEMQENIPSSWLTDGNSRQESIISFRQLDENVYGFASKHDTYNKTLVIDPVPTLLWIKNLPNWVWNSNTYYRVLANANQEVFTGFTTIAKYNVATSTYTIMDFYSQNYGYISKFDSSGNKIWGTYIGNHQFNYTVDESNLLKDIVITSNNEIYAIGRARDSQGGTNNITTPGAHKEHTVYQGQWAGYDYDAFLMKFNDNGVRLWGTYFGSDNSADSFDCIALDSNENVILGGFGGNSGITTPNAQIPTYIPGSKGIIVKFSPNGQQLYGSYFKISEGIKKINLDSFGNIYVASDDYKLYSVHPDTTPGVHQQNIIGYGNAYLAKLNSNFQFQWGTYFGGKNGYGMQYNSDEGKTNIKDFKIDQNNNIILLGNTDSHEKISTPGTHQTTRTSNLGNDIFLTKFSPTGHHIWGTYYGATTSVNVDDDRAYALSVDDNNNLIFSGYTSNDIQIATPNGFLPNDGGGYHEGFFTKFNTLGNQIWGTYFYRTINSIYAKSNNIYILGGTSTVNNFAKFYDCTSGISVTSNSPVCINSTLQLNASGGTSYNWTGPNGFTSTLQNPTIPNATASHSGVYSCQVSGSGSCDGIFTTNVVVGDNIAPIPNTATLPNITGDCHTVISTIPTATDNCAGTITATTTDPLSYSIPGTYVIHWTYDDGNGNISAQNQNVTVTATALPTTNSPQQTFCASSHPTVANLQITGQNIKWYDATGNILPVTTALVNGQIYYASQTINGCESNTIAIQVTITETPKPAGNSAQDFCASSNPTLANLIITGTAIKFYDAAGNVLPITTPLIHGVTYFVTQTLNNCESDKLPISVTLSTNNVPANDFSATICNSSTGNSMTIDLTSYQANLITNPGIYTFTYTDDLGNLLSNPSNYTMNVGSTVIHVKVATADGCFTVVRLSLTLNPKPNFSLPEKIDFCKGKTVTLDAGSGYSSYLWNTGATTQLITVSAPGNYSVTVTNSFGCQNTDNVEVSYTILPEITAINVNNSSATVILSATGNFEYSLDNFTWQNSNIFTNLNIGEYIVYVRTKEGCIIGQKPFVIFNIPNAFTPNGDGYNDKWKISGLENYPGTEVNVYDRRGLPVFKEVITKKPLEWDGKLNGSQISTGNYWYTIKVSDGRVYTGWLMVKNRE
jgi:gliding motility-associated-like protein